MDNIYYVQNVELNAFFTHYKKTKHDKNFKYYNQF